MSLIYVDVIVYMKNLLLSHFVVVAIESSFVSKEQSNVIGKQEVLSFLL